MQSHILELRKFIDPKLCSKIISYFDNSYNDAKTTNGSNKNIRNCLTRSLFDNDTLGKSIVSNFVQSKIFEICKIYKDKFPYFDYDKISQLDLLKYVANQYDAGYKYHVDMGYKAEDRQLSISIGLNNDFYGGEFKFSLGDNEVQYPQNTGDVVAFPSNFLYPHQVNKVTKGTRYAIIGWVI